MGAQRFDTLTRSLVAPGTRRGALTALLGGALGLLGLAEAEARRRKKRRRRDKKRRAPFCAGKDLCTDGGDSTHCESRDASDTCFCVVDSKTGKPFCAQNGFGTPADCSGCSEGEICMDCDPGFFCAKPCANPR